MGCLLLAVGLYLLFATPYWFAGVLCIIISMNVKSDSETPAVVDNNGEKADTDDNLIEE